MSANIDPRNSVQQLDRPAEPDENVTEEDVENPSTLAKLLIRILREVATLKRRFWPRRLDFEDVAVDNTASKEFRFPHGFGGRVRWWVVDWVPGTPGDYFQLERVVASTTKNVLVLTSGQVGTVTLRVEESGR